jgi:hypothetical protein
MTDDSKTDNSLEMLEIKVGCSLMQSVDKWPATAKSLVKTNLVARARPKISDASRCKINRER